MASSSSSESSDDELLLDENEKKRKNAKVVTPFFFKCRPQNDSPTRDQSKQQISYDSDPFSFDVQGNVDADGSDPELTQDISFNALGTSTTSSTKERCESPGLFEGFDADEQELKMILSKAVVQKDYDKRPVSDVSAVSWRQAKRLRKSEREKTTGNQWYSLPATELTDDHRRDLELLQMRDALDSKAHYKKPEREVLPKYYQVGRVIETKADFYSGRLTKKERKRTIVEELMADHEAIARNKRRYSALLGQKLKTRRGAYQQKGFLSKKSKRRNRQLKIQQQQKHAK